MRATEKMSSNALWGKVPDAPDDEVEQDIAAAIAEVRADIQLARREPAVGNARAARRFGICRQVLVPRAGWCRLSRRRLQAPTRSCAWCSRD